jgi:hypothetical protein
MQLTSKETVSLDVDDHSDTYYGLGYTLPNFLPVYLSDAEGDSDEESAGASAVDLSQSFLLRWRQEALWFGCNLPREQADLLVWCINNITDILDAQPLCDTWRYEQS